MPTPLPTRTLVWLAQHPAALAVVEPVWNALAELEAADYPPRLLAALRFVLTHHEPTRTGRCRACRRVNWWGLWRRRRFPCVVWRQIRGELLGPFALGGVHRLESPAAVTPVGRQVKLLGIDAPERVEAAVTESHPRRSRSDGAGTGSWAGWANEYQLREGVKP